MLPKLKTTSSYLSRIWNRQLLVFLFFLALSTIFWIFMAGKEQREVEFAIPVTIEGQPDNVVMTTDPPAVIHVTLKDEVFTLLGYRYNRQKTWKAVINWNEVSNAYGHVRLLTANVIKPIVASLHNTTEVIATTPDTIEFYYNYGLSKKVDVVIQGNIRADSTYQLIAKDVSPRKITVYAAKHILDTITAAYIQPVNLTHLTDTTTHVVRFQRIKGVKYDPDHVTLTTYADKLVDKTVQVAVRGINFPAGKVLRTFPPKVNVSFQIGANYYNKIDASAFAIAVNYADLIDNPSNTLHLQLRSIPEGVQRARITPTEVEYIIEDDTSE